MKQFKRLTRKQYNHKIGVTLFELLIAITLIASIVLVLCSIDLFSRHQVISSDRRIKSQNEVSYVLEHMSKEISMAIGNERVNGADSVVKTETISGDTAIWVYVDQNRNGLRDFPPVVGADTWIAYRLRAATAPLDERYRIWYCPRCTDLSCTICDPSWGTAVNILTTGQISDFTRNKPGGSTLSDNFVEIQITACWDPSGIPDACGTAANPNVTMSTRMKMPSVSTQ